VCASEVREGDWYRNAHTRRAQVSADDVVVFGAAGASGRLERAIPIGEYRGCAYRVRRDLLKTWGGLTTADGFLQRSAVPPLFRDPPAFLGWFRDQRPRLLEANWGDAAHDGLVEPGRVVTLPTRRIATA
jgi:hypothetical protein